MTSHATVTEEVQELASTYALGLLEGTESEEFERHLPGCAVCQSELSVFRNVASGLVHAAPGVQPSPRLKESLLRRISPARLLVRADDQNWEATPFPGVEIRRLFVDKLTGAVTILLRAAAGALYPAHRHVGIEQIYVIDGDLVFNDHTLETGDYEVNGPLSEHSSITSKTGCLAIIVHNLSDQILRS